MYSGEQQKMIDNMAGINGGSFANLSLIFDLLGTKKGGSIGGGAQQAQKPPIDIAKLGSMALAFL